MEEKQSKSEEINISEIVSIIFSNKKLIITITGLSILISLLIAFSLNETYKSSALLKASESIQSNGMGSLANQYNGLASIAGINLPSGDAETKKNLVLATITSRDFFKHLVDKYNYYPQIIAAKALNELDNKIIYDTSIYKDEKWIREEGDPTYLEAHSLFIKNNLELGYDKQRDHLTISIKHISPSFAKSMLDNLILEVNNVIREKDLIDSSNSLEYLKNTLNETQVKDIKVSINSLIEKKLEAKMLASIKEDYVLMIIDSPYIPLKPFAPNKLLILIFGFLSGILAGISIALIRSWS
jgi:uncharacterized protein involved in exopolysaccharide biosynthesis